MIQTDKLLRFLLYCKEMLVNINFNWQRCFTRKNDLLEKAATIKRFEYSVLGKELKAQTDIAKKQYQGLSKFFKSDEKEKLTIKKYNESDLIYNSKYRFYKYYSDSKKIGNFSSKSKNSFPNFLMIQLNLKN